MRELHKLTAASIQVVIRGATYRLSPLSDRDHSELGLWIKQHYLLMAREAIKGEENAEVRQNVLLAAAEHASRLSLGSDEAIEILWKNVDGIAQFVWLSLRREHPDITKETVYEITSDPEALEQIYEALDVLEGAPLKKKRRQGQPRKGNWIRRMFTGRSRSGTAGRRSRLQI